MSEGGSLKKDMTKLNHFMEGLSKLKSHTDVGIFGSRSGRASGGVTNAELGHVHELGSPTHGIPPRPFLRLPIILKGKQIYAKALQDVGRVIATPSAAAEMLEMLGRAAVDAIQEGFDTAGFGSWPQLKRSTLLGKLKGSLTKRQIGAQMQSQGFGWASTPLIRTGQLRRSIMWRVR